MLVIHVPVMLIRNPPIREPPGALGFSRREVATSPSRAVNKRGGAVTPPSPLLEPRLTSAGTAARGGPGGGPASARDED